MNCWGACCLSFFTFCGGVFLLFFFWLSPVFMCPILSVSLDCPFLVVPSIFSNFYLSVSLGCPFLDDPSIFSNFYFCRCLWVVHSCLTLWLFFQIIKLFISLLTEGSQTFPFSFTVLSVNSCVDFMSVNHSPSFLRKYYYCAGVTSNRCCISLNTIFCFTWLNIA